MLHLWLWQQGSKRLPGMAVTKSVVANDTSGKKREEVFVDIIEKISVTFNASVSVTDPPYCMPTRVHSIAVLCTAS